MEEITVVYKMLVRNWKGRDPLENLGIDRRKMYEQILNEQNVKVQYGFTRLGAAARGGFFYTVINLPTP
jgi:hypothetical protein